MKTTTAQTNDLCVKSMFLKGMVEDDRLAHFVASTEAVDADGDIVEQSWDLKRFKQNPVILFGHNSRELPIGKAIDVGVVDGQLETTIEFASAEANPMAEKVFNSVKEGTLRAVSVGFRPKNVRKETRDGKDLYVLSDNELFEISVVPIPSNPEALAHMKAKAMKETEPATQEGKEKETMNLEKMLDEIEQAKVALATEKEKVATLNERCGNLEEENNRIKGELQEHKTAAVNKLLDGLVGKKIAPVEKATLAKMAVAAPELFEEHMKAISNRPDMKLVDENVLGKDPTPPSLPVSTDGSGLDRFIQQRAF